ncbi:MAG: O-antigen ligase family protein [Prevotellaceae bacterium]|nr:O-antigen ligase family protein [Prevotellaceae bacterium]
MIRIYTITIRILLNLLILAVLSTVLIIGKDADIDDNIYDKYFWFYASMVLLAVIAVPAAIISRREKLSFNLPDLLIFLFSCAAVGITLSHTDRLTNKCMLLLFLMLLYFYLRIFLSDKSKLLYGLCCVFLVVTGLVEAIWGLRQLYGFADSQHGLFKITGSFFNPGPYSGWLAMVFPMALGFSLKGIINHKGHEVTQSSSLITPISSLLTVLCIILVLPAAMSRASWLAALGGSAFIGIIHGLQNKKISDYFKKHRKKIVILSFAAVILFAVAMVGLFLLKKDSASGRAFTWKIAVQTIRQHPLGVGLGNFGGSYGEMQAAYFASNAGTEREEYVATGVEYAFNEYLQICIETGIVPFLVFLAFVFYVLYLGIKNRNLFPTGSLVSLLIFASMSYPFNVLPFAIAFVFLSALCMADNRKIDETRKISFNWLRRTSFCGLFFLVAASVVITLCAYKICPLHYAYKQWKQMSYSMNNSEAIEEYAKQYPYLQDEISFLFKYANILSQSEQYEKSNEILQHAMRISCDPRLYNIMGKNYQVQKRYELAEQNFRKAANLVPNLLYPHYLLAKLYHEMGLKEKMEAEINIVLTKSPKVESTAVKKMRKELIQLTMNN